MNEKHVLPREHGAWFMWLIPMALGLQLAPVWHASAWWALALCTAGFFVRPPLVAWIKLARRQQRSGRPAKGLAQVRLWVGALSGLSLALAAGLLAWGPAALLAPLVAAGGLCVLANLWLEARRKAMSLGGELLGVAGLALCAPLTYIAASHRADIQAFWLWLLCALFFGGSIFYVRLKVRRQARKPSPPVGARLSVARACLLYHAAALSLVAALCGGGWLLWSALLLWLPVTLKCLLGAWRWQEKPQLARLGMIEAAHSLAFYAMALVFLV